MTVVGIGLRNVWRNRIRAVLTVLGVAVAVLTFLFLRTIWTSWMVGVEYSAKDRIGTRHKVTFILPLPLRYVEQIRQVPGVVEASYANWFGAKNPKDDRKFFASVAVDTKTFFKVFSEVELSPEEKSHWLENRRGAIVGDMLAKQFGWKRGDHITLSGTIYPGDWEFDIEGVYTASRSSIDRSTLFFNWDYLNDSLDARRKDQVGWVAARVNDAGQAATISARIDKLFADQDVQTLSMSERAMNTSFLGMMNAVLKALNVVSIVILLIMALILGNTIAMGVRERTHEYGVLRAIGFMPRHLTAFILGEAILIGALGGALGILLGVPFINQAVGKVLEENMGSFFPYFRVTPQDALIAAGLSIGLATMVAAIPARQAGRLNTTDALRRVG